MKISTSQEKIVQEKNECNILQFFTTPQKFNFLTGKKMRNNTQKEFHFCQTYIRLCVSPLLALCGYFRFGYTILVFWKCKKMERIGRNLKEFTEYNLSLVSRISFMSCPNLQYLVHPPHIFKLSSVTIISIQC